MDFRGCPAPTCKTASYYEDKKLIFSLGKSIGNTDGHPNYQVKEDELCIVNDAIKRSYFRTNYYSSRKHTGSA